MSNKPKGNKKKKQLKNYDDTPVIKSPAKTVWGKVTIIIIVAAMIILPLVSLILMLLDI